MPIQVRLKPYNPTTGHTARSLSFVSLGGVLFEEGKIVESINDRPIPQKTADFLRTVHSKPSDPASPLAFDVLEAADMKKLLATEARVRLGLNPDMVQALLDEFGAAEAKQAEQPAQRQQRRQRATA